MSDYQLSSFTKNLPQYPAAQIPALIEIFPNGHNIACFAVLDQGGFDEKYEEYINHQLDWAFPDQIDITSVEVYFEQELVLVLTVDKRVKFNRVVQFYKSHPLFINEHQSRFLVPPPSFLLGWEMLLNLEQEWQEHESRQQLIEQGHIPF